MAISNWLQYYTTDVTFKQVQHIYLILLFTFNVNLHAVHFLSCTILCYTQNKFEKEKVSFEPIRLILCFVFSTMLSRKFYTFTRYLGVWPVKKM